MDDFDSSLHDSKNATMVVPAGAIVRMGNTLMENTSCSGDVNITLYEFKNGTNEGVVVAFNDDYVDPVTNETTGCSYLEWTNPGTRRRRRLLAIDEPPTFLAVLLCVTPPCTASTRGEVAVPLLTRTSSPPKRAARRAMSNDEIQITASVVGSVFVVLIAIPCGCWFATRLRSGKPKEKRKVRQSSKQRQNYRNVAGDILM
jgi:hypothetical protein